MKRRLVIRNCVALIVAIAPIVVLARVWDTQVYFPGWLHFAGVGVAAAAATAAAIALTVAGALEGDGRAVVAGLAFSLMAALLCLHGAATPGFIVGMNGVVAFTGAATLPVGCAILALGSLPVFNRPGVVRHLIAALVLGSGAIIVLGVSAILVPTLVPAVPRAGGPVALTTLALGGAACFVLEVRAVRTYRLTHRVADLSVAVGIVWIAAALTMSLTTGYTDLGWWIGHLVEICGIALVGIPVARDLRLGAAHRSRPLVGDLRGADLVASAEAFFGSHVRALLVALEQKDTSTEVHTRRVALLAAQVGDELGLPPGRLRNLADRRPASRHRQAFGARCRVEEAGPADGCRVRRDSTPSRRGRPAVCRSSVASPTPCSPSCTITMSDSTAPATQEDASRPSFRSMPGFLAPATSMTRLSRRVSTATPGHPSRRCSSSVTASTARSTAR